MTTVDKPQSDSSITYRSGVAARSAGLSPETLRVWERRYNLSGAHRSARGQRLYSPEQVARLRLLKLLVDQGHPIGGLATMTQAQLRELSTGATGHHRIEGPIRAAIVGGTLAQRIAADARDGAGLVVQSTGLHLEHAATQALDEAVDLLIVEQSELHDRAVPLIAAARAAAGASAVLVLYRFCSSATIRALRARGCLAARVPADFKELMLLCRAAVGGDAVMPEPAPVPPAMKFDEQTLLTIIGAGSDLRCECPKHLAEVLITVGSFERYSAQCASRNEDDTRLHKDLERAAAHARAILEAAMERLARAEGLPLPGQLRT